MNEIKVKVAFIGAGYMTSEHIKAFTDSNVELVGIFFRTKSRAEALALEINIPIICDSVEELYRVTKADLVVISVPELSVKTVCLEVFNYSWACLIEKPAGYDLADAMLIADAAKKSNTCAYVALNRRHYSSTREVLAELSGYSQPRIIHVYDQEDPKAALLAGQPELVVKNWMYANSIHMIDFFNVLGRGKVISIENINPWNSSNPRFVMSLISYDSGDIGIYEAVWNAPGPWAVVVTTQDKRWEMRLLEQAFVQYYGSRKQEPIAVNELDTKFKPGLRLQAEEAIKAVSGQKHNLPTLDDALESMKLVKSIYFES